MASADAVIVTSRVRSRSGDHGAVFLGVPYAAGPTGRHRFSAPQPHAGWTDVRDARTPGATAPQPALDAFGTLNMSPFFGPAGGPATTTST